MQDGNVMQGNRLKNFSDFCDEPSWGHIYGGISENFSFKAHSYQEAIINNLLNR